MDLFIGRGLSEPKESGTHLKYPDFLPAGAGATHKSLLDAGRACADRRQPLNDLGW